MLKNMASFFSALVLSVVSLFVFHTPGASAAVIEWDGGGADNNLSTAENWVGDVAPVSGDSLTFDAVMVGADICNAPPIELINDFDPMAYSFAGVNFTGFDDIEWQFCEGGGELGVTISGADLVVTDDITNSYFGRNWVTLDLGIIINNDVSLINMVNITGDIIIGDNNLRLASSSTSGGVSGSGDVVIEASADAGGGGGGGSCGEHSTSYPVGGNSSSFSGTLNVFTMLRVTTQNGDLTANASNVTVHDRGTLLFQVDYAESLVFDTPITLSEGARLIAQQTSNVDCEYSDSATVEITSEVTANGAVEVYPRNKVDIILSGNVVGEDNLAVPSGISEPGALILPGGETKTSAIQEITVESAEDCSNIISYSNNAINIINADCSEAYPYLSFSGTLKGIGVLGEVVMRDGSTIAPGLSPGVLTVGALTLEVGSNYEFELAGTTVGDEYDQIAATDSVTIQDAILDVVFLNDYIPAVGDEFVIILNEGSDPISGTFDGLAEGAEVVVDGVTFTISYEGGDGNDVVLTVTDAPAPAPDAPDTGFALVMANPIVTLLVSIASAAALFTIARRQFSNKH